MVDEAFERAETLASKLAEAAGGSLGEVARALCSLSGTTRPLAVARLRGGTWTSKHWGRCPSQPTIICSTVDQVGSALLFGAYGRSPETASIYAGLVAHDSMIILDEAHCAMPFMQTLEAVAQYRRAPWSERVVETPFFCCVMSATPPESIEETAVFPMASERAAALGHPRLQKRITARKVAELEKPVKGGDGQFEAEAARLALNFRDQGKQRVAVMVNRVATARNIASRVRGECGDSADVVLLTGRLRPLDRDALMSRWKRVLKAGSTEALQKPVIVVTTQCLEVGADFSFDSLVTECASLDSLRQRFGRLDRLGDLAESYAAILIRASATKQPKGNGDPIYGKALYETWTWLSKPEQQRAEGTVDFGYVAMDERVGALRTADPQGLQKLLAPSDEAPVLLPAHLDLLCQTSPRPVPAPDISLFLHGKGPAAAEVRVTFRADLQGDNSDVETLSIVPPTSPEMLTVPMHRLKAWLLEEAEAEDVGGDVEGARLDAGAGDSRKSARCRFVIWRGRERSEVTDDVGRVRPNDVLVLTSKQAIFELGQETGGAEGLGQDRLDLAERAFRQARGRAVLRVHRSVLEPLCSHASVADLIRVAESGPERGELLEALGAVLDEDSASIEGPEQERSGPLPKWLTETVADLLAAPLHIEEHPAGGVVLIGKTNLGSVDEDDLFADADDLTSESTEPVSLQAHTDRVKGFAAEFAARCADHAFVEAFLAAAEAHDLGKLDWRFQLLLRGGDWTAMSALEPLAKSAALPSRKRTWQEINEDARLPKGFRHEFLSMQLAERFGLGPADQDSWELVLHLIASHHGYARPFAPPMPDKLVADGSAGDLCLNAAGISDILSGAERGAMTPVHRIDSGVPERFWRLTRRYGWWGLAYLESVFRLADWEASRGRVVRPKALPMTSVAPSEAPAVSHRIALNALDGANPLAFLAALGTLRLLTRILPQYHPRLNWEQRMGAWRPALWTAEPLDEARICEELWRNGLDLTGMFSDDLLASTITASPKNKKGEASWKDKLKFPVNPFRQFCCSARERSSVLAEFAAVWAAETGSSDEEEGNQIAFRTRFDFTAGQQAFVGMLRQLKEICTRADLQRSLFTGWRYSTGAVSMRWDTQDEKRQYALQSSDPTKSNNPPVADPGANFLAVEGLPLFPLVPNRQAGQAGFDGKGDGRSWSWPIWTHPIGLDVVRSLLAVPLTDAEQWPPTRRREIGISTVFQSRIVMPSGRYRCFTPARSV